MKISKLPADYKPSKRFTRPAHIKTDTHYIFTTKKFVAEVVYHSSMFYAPEFYKVTVKNADGRQIWSGGDTMFLDTLFLTDFISDEFERMILTRVNSTESSSHSQIILIDLKTGQEEALTKEGAYYSAGHFISFDGIYYSDSRGTHCIYYGNNTQFLLRDILNKHFAHITTWGTCAVKDCMLVITGETENNLYLFNLVKQKIEDRTTFLWRKADSVFVNMGNAVKASNSVISVSYSDRQPSGALRHRETEYFNLEFGKLNHI